MQGESRGFDIVLTTTNRGTAERMGTLERGNTYFQGGHTTPNSPTLKNLTEIQLRQDSNV